MACSISKYIKVSSPKRDLRINSDLLWRVWIGRAVKPYFLMPYKECHLDSWVHEPFIERKVNGKIIRVERYIHSLCFGLRQGVLAIDIFTDLDESKPNFEHEEANAIIKWVQKKVADGCHAEFLKKLEMVSAFQRSGRQCDVSRFTDIETYKRYEKQDALNFTKAAKESGIFDSKFEILLFSEALLWSNPGSLDEKEHPDLKYLRRIIRTAHTLDLRRSSYFRESELLQQCLDLLFGTSELPVKGTYGTLIMKLWKRAGEYLAITGDTDLVTKRPHTDEFFLQSKYPSRLVEAITSVAKSKTVKVRITPRSRL